MLRAGPFTDAGMRIVLDKFFWNCGKEWEEENVCWHYCKNLSSFVVVTVLFLSYGLK